MHTLIPIELLPYLQCVAITETKGSLDEFVTYSYVLIGLTLQDMKQVTSVVSNITWGQELFRLVCYVEKSHGHDQLHLYTCAYNNL
jgi:hypothetical protein